MIFGVLFFMTLAMINNDNPADGFAAGILMCLLLSPLLIFAEMTRKD